MGIDVRMILGVLGITMVDPKLLVSGFDQYHEPGCDSHALMVNWTFLIMSLYFLRKGLQKGLRNDTNSRFFRNIHSRDLNREVFKLTTGKPLFGLLGIIIAPSCLFWAKKCEIKCIECSSNLRYIFFAESLFLLWKGLLKPGKRLYSYVKNQLFNYGGGEQTRQRIVSENGQHPMFLLSTKTSKGLND